LKFISVVNMMQKGSFRAPYSYDDATRYYNLYSRAQKGVCPSLLVDVINVVTELVTNSTVYFVTWSAPWVVAVWIF